MRLKLAVGTALTWSMTVAVPALAQGTGDTAADPIPLIAGEQVVGQVQNASDIEWFQVQLDAGQTYTFDVQGQATNAGTLGDPLAILMDAELNEVARDDDGGVGLDSSLTFTPQTTGGYLLSVSSFGSESGDFLLTFSNGAAATAAEVAAAPTDDFEDTPATSGQLALGSNSYGELETAGDGDWFAIYLQPGQQILIDLEGAPTNQGTLSDPLVAVYDANGVQLDRNDDGGEGLNSQLAFTAPEAGTYYVGAGAFGSATGSYRLSAAAQGDIADAAPAQAPATPTADDHPASTATGGRLTVGGSVTGNLEGDGDEDWFAIDLSQGQRVIFDLEGNPTGQGTLSDPYLTIYDAAGNEIDRNDDGGDGLNSQLDFTAPSAGTYYVEARGFAGNSGTYRLSAQQGLQAVQPIQPPVADAGDDYPSGPETTGRLNLGGSVSGNLEAANDTDWFAINLSQDQTVVLSLEGNPTGQGTLSDPYLTVFDFGGNELDRDDDGGDGFNSRLEFTPPSTGTFYVEARGFGGNSGTYRLSAQAAAPQAPTVVDDYSSDTGTAGQIGVGGSVLGNLEASSDEDWFAISLSQGQTVVFDLQGEDTGQGTLSDPYLTIFDQFGNQVDSNDDGGSGYNSQLTFTAPASGVYFVEARGFAGASGTYLLSAAPGAAAPPPVADDYPADSSTPGFVAVDGFATGVIEQADDADWFGLQLAAGQTVDLSLEGSATGGGDLNDPLMVIYDQFGNQLDRNDDGGEGLNSSLSFTAPSAGTYYVSAEAFGASTGSYTLYVDDATPAQVGGKGPSDDYAGDASTTGFLSVGGSVSGNLEQIDDTDWFAIQLSAGQAIEVSLEGQPTGAGSLPDPVLAIFDQFGNEVAYNDDGGDSWNSLLTFTAPAAGTYYLSAEGFGESTGTYLLSAVPGQPDDYPADMSTTGFVGIGRPVSGSIDSPGDTDWFAVNLNAGQPVIIRQLGNSAGGGSLQDPYLELYDGNGQFIDSNDDDDVSLNSAIAFTPWMSGTHYIAAGAFSDYTGSYTLSVEVGAPIRDDYASDTSTVGQAQVNGTVYGELESPNDEDWFWIQLQPGNYVIDLEGQATGMGSLNDPYLVLYNAQGFEIDRNDDGGQNLNSQLRLSVGAPATYYIGAGAFGSGVGTYALTVTGTGGGGK